MVARSGSIPTANEAPVSSSGSPSDSEETSGAPRGARILAIDDEADAVSLYVRALQQEGHEVVGAATLAAGRARAQEGGFGAVLLDQRLPDGDGERCIPELKALAPDAPIIMITNHGSTTLAVRAIRAGAYDFLEKPFAVEALRVAVQNALAFGRLARQEGYHRQRAYDERYFGGGAAAVGDGFDEYPAAARELLRRGAPTRATVLLTGETGVGKEHVAALLHRASGRNGAFVPINCAAIPAQLAESELFGHERGAFTGADRPRPGCFEVADGGTLFLDEVGELTAELQAKLLRAVQSGEVARVGGRAARHVDVRIIAATNRDLLADVAAGRFREDLYFRLCVLHVAIPPLRERRERVLPLATLLLRRAETQVGRRFEGFDADARALLATYPFRGNVRELANAVERAAILSDGPLIGAAALGLVETRSAGGAGVGAVAATPPVEAPAGASYREARDEFERAYFRAVLARAAGNQSEAARIAGLHRNNLRAHLERLGVLEQG